MKLTGWGKYPIIDAHGYIFEKLHQLRRFIQEPCDCIPHGMGRSYGDSALNERVVFSGHFNKIYAFDPDNGIVTCESGITLADLLHIFIPKGWFLPVTPGTKFITVGGAIAADVHGKNHHANGCFSQWVLSFDLMLPDGQVMTCSPKKNRILFSATCGGMGLTGVILSAKIKMFPVKSAVVSETVARCTNLEEIFHRFEQLNHMSYSMAWIDCLAEKDHIGRSVIMAGEISETGARVPPSSRPFISVPIDLPGFCLNPHAVSLFNHLYYRKYPLYREGRHTPLNTFFYPLDSIGYWNRMYGKKGFTQYQLVLPKKSSYYGIHAVLKKIAAKGMGFLGVLKLLGPQNNNYLSFPMEGYTLAIDFKIGDKLFSFLNTLDHIVADHGGRLYLAKDVRMPREIFHKGYPEWEKFSDIRDTYGMKKKFNSLQSKRLEI